MQIILSKDELIIIHDALLGNIATVTQELSWHKNTTRGGHLKKELAELQEIFNRIEKLIQ